MNLEQFKSVLATINNDELQKYNRRLIKKIYSTKETSDFIEHYHISEATVNNHLSIFDHYLRYLDKEAAIMAQVPIGYEMKLSYQNDIIDYYYALLSAKQDELMHRGHLKNYLISHIPYAMQTVFPETVNFENRSLEYQTIFLVHINALTMQSTKGVLLIGPNQYGKSFMLMTKANQLAREGNSVCFVKMTPLFNRLKQCFETQDYADYHKLLHQLQRCDFLVFDDFGSENATAWSRDEVLFPILDYRLEHRLLTCFTTNYSQSALLEKYQLNKNNDEIGALRLMSRILALSEPVIIQNN